MRKGVMGRIVLPVAIGLLAGCGPGRVPVYPVSGRVTIDGKPPAGWVAVLHREPAPRGPYPHPLPRADVGTDGRFRFYTYAAGDGAPAGTYRISFVHTEGASPRQVYGREPVEVPPEPSELRPLEITTR